MKAYYNGHDARTESICIDCTKFSDCKYAREGKTICNNFVRIIDEK